jgi:YjbE family integral membrane protein
MEAMELIASSGAWIALADIMLVNIVLSGDNAVVIALAAHSLPLKQQKPAIILGSVVAVFMRAILTIFALKLLVLPYLKIAGGILLFYIAVKLMLHQHKTSGVASYPTLGTAVRTILLADLVMSLDNVLGVAAAAKGNVMLLLAGLAMSVPLIAFGSTLVLKVMMKYPIVILLGTALLGYLGGEMLFSDTAIRIWVQTNLPNSDPAIGSTELHMSMPGVISALAAVLLGSWFAKRKM